MEPLTRDLLRWFRTHRRDLPWRRNRNPYRVWVSEAMLQQTRVETVIPYFGRFLERFPDIRALAAASEAEVLRAWEGLGYYRRARNLLAGARATIARHDGVIPDDPAALRALPGVGPYTAGAIAAIAFGRPEPAVDGNVTRVVSRIEGWALDPTRATTRRRVTERLRHLYPPRAASDFTESLMELGALVCAPRDPACDRCPIAGHCLACKKGDPERYPRRVVRRPSPVEHRVVAVVTNRFGRVLLVRRPDDGLLAGLWAFPDAACTPPDPPSLAATRAVRSLTGLRVRPETVLCRYRHVFTHRTWAVTALCCPTRSRLVLPRGVRWLSRAERGEVAIPTAFRPILAALGWETPHAAGQGRGDHRCPGRSKGRRSKRRLAERPGFEPGDQA